MALLFVLLLSIQGQLDQMAQSHAEVLISEAELFHSNIAPLFATNGGPCEWAGEVIYRGGDPDARWEAYANSPSHNQVVNTPRTHHGVGIAESGGIFTVVDIFCYASEIPTTTKAPATTPATTPPPPESTPPPVIDPELERTFIAKAPPLCPSRSICVY